MDESLKKDYTFVYAKAPCEAVGWWLKISSMQMLEQYVMDTQAGTLQARALELYTGIYFKHGCGDGKSVRQAINDEMSPEERLRLMMGDTAAWNCMYGAIMQAESLNGTIMDGLRSTRMEAGTTYIRRIREDGRVFINRNGGCNSFIEYDTFCHRKSLVWPSFQKSDLRLRQYDGGTHWYAYIDDFEVKNPLTGSARFFSESDARNTAMDIINKA